MWIGDRRYGCRCCGLPRFGSAGGAVVVCGRPARPTAVGQQSRELRIGTRSLGHFRMESSFFPFPILPPILQMGRHGRHLAQQGAGAALLGLQGSAQKIGSRNGGKKLRHKIKAAKTTGRFETRDRFISPRPLYQHVEVVIDRVLYRPSLPSCLLGRRLFSQDNKPAVLACRAVNLNSGAQHSFALASWCLEDSSTGDAGAR